MRPVQILANNLLYDIGQTAIPTDNVDPERLMQPRAWDIKELTRFIAFIGPCSSVFDYSTFLLMLYVFDCWNVSTPQALAQSASVFQTGWFVESLLTQTLIIHIIRTNKLPFLQSRASWFVTLMSLFIAVVGVSIPFSPLGPYLGFTRLPSLYWPLLGLTLVGYMLLTQGVKMFILWRKWICQGRMRLRELCTTPSAIASAMAQAGLAPQPPPSAARPRRTHPSQLRLALD